MMRFIKSRSCALFALFLLLDLAHANLDTIPAGYFWAYNGAGWMEGKSCGGPDYSALSACLKQIEEDTKARYEGDPVTGSVVSMTRITQLTGNEGGALRIDWNIEFSIFGSTTGYVYFNGYYSHRTCPAGYVLTGPPNEYKTWYNVFCQLPAQQIIPEKNLAQCNTAVKNPIQPNLGNKYQFDTDIAFDRLKLTRQYNSLQHQIFEFGANWRSGFHRTFNQNVGSILSIADEMLAAGRTTMEVLATLVTKGGQSYRFKHTLDFNTGNTITPQWTTYSDIKARLESISSASGTLTGFRFYATDNTIETYNLDGRLQSIKWPDGYRQTFSYDSVTRQLLTVEDSLGKSLSFGYTPEGRVSTVSDHTGRQYQYVYDANNNLTTVIYPDTTTKEYVYDDPNGVDLLSGIIDQRGIRYATYAYDSQQRAYSTEHAGGVDKAVLTYNGGNSVTVTNGRGIVTSYSYVTAQGTSLPSNIVGPGCAECGNGNTQYIYEPATNNLLFKTKDNLTTEYGDYDTNGQAGYKIEAVGTPEERRTDYTYDNRFFNKISTITEASVYPGAQKVTTYQYDDFGNMTAITISGFTPSGTPISRTTTMQYNGPLNQLSQIDGPRNETPPDVTTFEYYPDDPAEGNNRARLKRVTNALSQTVRQDIQYSATGKILSENRPNGPVNEYGLTLNYTYYAGNDRLETLTEIDDAISRTTRWTYLPSGEVATITRGYGTPDATTIQFGYDNARRLTTITDGAGNKIEYTLDSEGNKTAESIYDNQDVLRKTLAQTFDVYNRLNVFSQANEQQDYDYNPDGTLDKVTDGNQVVTQYTYDELKRLTTTTQDTNIITQYGYDAADRLTTVTDPNNNATSYIYDDLGNLLSQTSPDTGTTTFAYDEAGNMIQKTDAKGQVFNYIYDVTNRLIQIRRPDHTDYTSYIYDYDCGGTGTQRNRRGQLCYMRTTTENIVIGTWFSYNAFGEIIDYETHSLLDSRPLPDAVQYQYDLAGRINQITYPSSAIVNYSYNAAGQVTQVELNYQGQITVLAGNIQYAPFGPVTDLLYGNGLPLSQSLDSAYRYTAHTVSGILELANSQYDANGSLIQIDDNLTLNSSQYGYDALNRIDTATGTFGSQDFSYDTNSNRLQYTQDGVPVTYLYEPNTNRLTQAANDPVSLDANGNTIQRGDWTYIYNNDNRLIEVQNNGVLVANYFYNGLNQRVSKTVAGLISDYVYGLNGELLHEVNSNGHIDYIYLNGRPLAMLQQDQLYYIHTDHLGTPRAVSDDRGKAMWTWDSDPFGQTPAVVVGKGRYAADFTFNFRFPGQYYDEETGLHYNHHRYYDPSTGRYLTSDPIGLEGGLNTFGYVGGNPLSLIDPQGLDAEYVFEQYGLYRGYINNVRAGFIHRYTAENSAKEYMEKNNISGITADSSNNGGVADAIRHCVWTCEMTRDGGYDVAKDIADMHERDNGNTATEMDQRNNEMGCFIGENGDKEKSCEELCIENVPNLMITNHLGETVPAGNRRF